MSSRATAGGALQVCGLALGAVGTLGAVAVTLMPQWRVSAFVGSNIVVFETLWEGLWMSCMRHTNIRMQCKVYDSLLALPPDLQAARGLMCAACALALLALGVGTLGMRCIHCLEATQPAKAYLLLVAGLAFVAAGLAVLIPVCWVAHAVIRDFYDPILPEGTKRELGDALYLGWAVALILLAGGATFCCSFGYSGHPSFRYAARPRPETVQSHRSRKMPSLPSKSQYV
ncbi:claudin-8 [Tachyglossus aculeatus]|uniref:claudin-8 n=1 Tax=Tachyglossus aculeatus TaxID=9261 RepID=UPI0018F3FA08|nr:claudin-8 [Tachyglossus aculeatus]